MEEDDPGAEVPYSTLGDLGLDRKGFGRPDWLYVGEFGPSYDDRANLTALQHFIGHKFGPSVFKLVVERDKVGDVAKIHFTIAPSGPLWRYCDELVSIAENGEHICDEMYWDIVDPVIQQRWAGMDMIARIELVRQAGIDPIHVIREEVDATVHDLIYQEHLDL